MVCNVASLCRYAPPLHHFWITNLLRRFYYAAKRRRHYDRGCVCIPAFYDVTYENIVRDGIGLPANSQRRR